MKKFFLNLMMACAATAFFTACDDVPEPYNIKTDTDPTLIIRPTGDGTLANPYNVAAVDSVASLLSAGSEIDHDIYFKGIVSSIKEQFTATYGNGTFYISDDGTSDNEFYVYRAYYLNNKKFTSGDAEINIGDTVVICGRVMNYNGTLETTQNKSYVYSINGGGGSDTPADPGKAEGDGTLENPYNAVAANAYVASLGADLPSETAIYIKGKVASIVENFSTTYGNATYYISDDGTTSNAFYVFRSYYLNNKKYTSGTLLKEGDEVIVCGKVVNYYGNTPETVQNGSYLYSLNGSTGETDTPSTDGAKGDGTLENPFNSVAANAYASSLAANEQSDKDVYIKGKIVSIEEAFSTTYGNSTFYISDDGTSANQFLVFRTYYLGNVKYTSGDLPQVGDEVIICGKVTNYYGNTPETVQNESYIYSLTSNGGGSVTGGDDEPSTAEGISISGTTVTLTNSGTTAGSETIEVDLSTLGYKDASSVGTVTLSDETTIEFDANGEQNGPKYYDKTNGVRVYKNNTITFNGKAKIAKVVLTCDSYGSTDYVGNETATLSCSENKMVYTNLFTGTSGGGVQLRIKTITITYAE